jgi:hypothetical protein
MSWIWSEVTLASLRKINGREVVPGNFQLPAVLAAKDAGSAKKSLQSVAQPINCTQ